MIRISAIVGAAGIMLSTTALASPIVKLLDFDHATNAFIAPLSYYGGLHWLNFDAIRAADAVPLGLPNALVSPSYEAIPNDPNMISGFYSPKFTLKDAYFGAGARNGLNIEVAGFNAGFKLLYDTSFTVDTLGPTFETFNWTGVSFVLLAASGGTLDPATNPRFDSTLFSLDNLRIIDLVPEPGVTALFGLGLGALAMRRRRAA